MAKKVIKRGRPSIVNWSKFNFAWKNKTDSDIAVEAGCTVVNVFLRRKRMIAKAIADGKDASAYICSKPKWSRGKYASAKRAEAKAKENQNEVEQTNA